MELIRSGNKLLQKNKVPMRIKRYKIGFYAFNPAIALLLVLIVSLLPGDSLLAQKDARDLYKRAMKTTNAEERINLLKRATEIDATFGQAYYELGKILETNGSSEDALLNFKRALVANPAEMNDKQKFEIVYKIGLLQRKIGRTGEAIKTLSGALNLSPERETQGDIYQKLGELNEEVGNIDRAIECYSKARRLMPQNASIIEKQIASLQKAKHLHQTYNEGLAHLRLKRYQEAIAALEKVVSADSGFKDAKSNLEKARREFDELQKTSEWAKTYNNRVEQIAGQSGDQAGQLFRKLVETHPIDGDSGTSIQASSAKLTTARQRQADSLYNIGLTEFNKKNWVRAIYIFNRVLKSDPAHTEAKRKRQQARWVLRNEKKDTMKEQYYVQGVDAYQLNDWIAAIEMFERLVEIDPGYKDAQQLLTGVRQAQAKQNSLDELDSLYQSGIQLSKQGDWLNALIVFEKVQMINPEYKAVKSFSAEARQALAGQSPRDLSRKTPLEANDSGWVKIVAVLMITLLVFAVLIFIPAIRGKLFILRGKTEQASQVYQRMYEKHPRNLKLCLNLGNMLYKLHREDEKAVKIYETILRHGLDTPYKKGISTIVAYHYLKNGNADQDKIKILEQALSSEINHINPTIG
ncbi:DUF2225 domain-containing protein [candidate division KSB1 bacterium]|nr:DUF2225 domain-containing protein [candidate division KSB1 bacterium]